MYHINDVSFGLHLNCMLLNMLFAYFYRHALQALGICTHNIEFMACWPLLNPNALYCKYPIYSTVYCVHTHILFIFFLIHYLDYYCINLMLKNVLRVNFNSICIQFPFGVAISIESGFVYFVGMGKLFKRSSCATCNKFNLTKWNSTLRGTFCWEEKTFFRM